MIKRIIICCLLLLTAVYFAVAVTVFNSKPIDRVASGLELTIADSSSYRFICDEEVYSLLKKKKLHPVGKKAKDINIRQLEDEVTKHPFVRKAECYLTSGGKVRIDIDQRIPLVRVMSGNGDDYYIDNEGKIMPAGKKAIHVAIASGYIDRKFAQKELFELGKFLKQDPFWQSQIQQIHITPKQDIELVPRAGDHIIFLGKLENMEEKFRKLRTFYREGLNHVGWNKYDRISIEFSNQIICTKKE